MPGVRYNEEKEHH